MRSYRELLDLAYEFGLDPANESVEDTIAQRDLLLGCIGGMTTASTPTAFAESLLQADKAAECVEAIVDGLLDPATAEPRNLEELVPTGEQA